MVQQQVSEHANQWPQTSKTKMGPTWLPDAGGSSMGSGSRYQCPYTRTLPWLIFGPFDILSQFGLSKHAGVAVHNPASQDQIDAIMPLATLACTQVHHGQMPLWNPYGGLGTPLAFNFHSAPFWLPAIICYLAPVAVCVRYWRNSHVDRGRYLNLFVRAGSSSCHLGKRHGVHYL